MGAPVDWGNVRDYGLLTRPLHYRGVHITELESHQLQRRAEDDVVHIPLILLGINRGVLPLKIVALNLVLNSHNTLSI